MKSEKLKGKILLFDLDGTLVETDYSNFLAYKEAIHHVLNKKITYNPKKRFNRNELLSIFPHIKRADIEKIIKIKGLCYRKYLHKTNLNETVYSLLLRYYKTNRTFLVTNSRKERALMILEYYDLKKKFEKAFYLQPDSAKGDANKFKIAISKLNVNPQLVVIFENDHTEISKALSVGILEENILAITKK